MDLIGAYSEVAPALRKEAVARIDAILESGANASFGT
jgi:hypothetical protein